MGVSTLGPVYLSTEIKNKYRDACDEKAVTMEAEIKNKVMDTIREVYPGWKPVSACHR